MIVSVRDQEYNLGNRDYIREIYLFGSVARGEADEYSDIDILIVVDDCEDNRYFEIKKELSDIFHMPAKWLSVYQISKVEQMWQKGSYFLWHIKKEGVKLYSVRNELEDMLQRLPHYYGYSDDLREYQQICKDVRDALNEDEDVNYEYELSVLASIIRNTCIAIDYMCGEMVFGRTSAVEKCIELFKEDISFTMEEYDNLYQYRLWVTGKKVTVPEANKELVLKWLLKAEQLVELGMEKGENRHEK